VTDVELGDFIDGQVAAADQGDLVGSVQRAFERVRPDVVVTIADRHETLATAIAASYQHIPLCHVQGGEVSGSIDDKVRNAVTQLSDIHCVSTLRAARNVEAMVGAAGHIYHTGCPSVDLAAEAVRLGPLIQGAQPLVVVLQHPVTEQADQSGDQMRATIEALEPYRSHTLYFWPGEDAGADSMTKALRMAGLEPTRNLRALQFLRLLLGVDCIVGNSSVGIRECSYMGIPAVNVGSRQEGRERATNVVDAPHDAKAIRDAVMAFRTLERRPERSCLYGDGEAGGRIAAILAAHR